MEAMTRLTRLVSRKPDRSELLRLAIRPRLSNVLEVTLRAARDSGEVAGTALLEILQESSALEDFERIIRLCQEKGNFLPISWRQAALLAIERVLTIYEAEAQVADSPEGLRSLRETYRLIGSLATHYDGLGMWRQALEQSDEAVRLHRALLALTGDSQDKYHLAVHLSNHSKRLGNVARWEDAYQAASEAVRLHREALASSPSLENLPVLASALDNLSITASETARAEEALVASREAVEFRRSDTRTNNEAWPHYATSLSNLAGRLYESGELSEALAVIEESIQIRRDLDVVGHLTHRPGLARSQHNLARIHEVLGDLYAAQKASRRAVELRRELYQQDPRAFRMDLIRSLSSLGSYARKLGRTSEALGYLAEAQELGHLEEEEDPGVAIPSLLYLHQQSAEILEEDGKLAEAATAWKAIFDLRSRYLKEDPDQHLVDFLVAAWKYIGLLGRLRRYKDTIKAIGLTRRTARPYLPLQGEVAEWIGEELQRLDLVEEVAQRALG